MVTRSVSEGRSDAFVRITESFGIRVSVPRSRVGLPLAVLLFVLFARNASAAEISRLVDALDDKNIQQGAAIALAKLGEEAVPALRISLKSESSETQIWSAYTLGEIGSAARPSVKDLATALKSNDAELRATVAQALGKIGDESSVASLTSALGDKAVEVRRRAAIALGELGKAATPAVAELSKLLADDDVRIDARAALLRIGPEVADGLVDTLTNEAIRFDATFVLLKLVPEKAKQLGLDKPSNADFASLRLVLFNAQRNSADHKRAAESLAQLGPAGIKILVEAFEESSLQRTSAEAFTHANVEAVPLLRPVLSHKDATVRATAILAIEHMGSKASAATSDLIRLLTDNDRNVRFRAVRALHAFGKKATPAIAALSKVIANSGEQEPTRQWAIKTLMVTLPETRDAVVKGLIGGAKEKRNYGVRQLALQFLKQLAPEEAKKISVR